MIKEHKMGCCMPKSEHHLLVDTQPHQSNEYEIYANKMMLADMYLCDHVDCTGRWRKYLPAMREFWSDNDLPQVLVPLQDMLVKHIGSYNDTNVEESEEVLLCSDRFHSSLKPQIENIVNHFEAKVAESEEWKQIENDPIASIWAASMYYSYANALKTDIIHLDGNLVVSRIELSKEYQKVIAAFEKGLDYFNLSKIRIELSFTYFESYLLESVEHTRQIVEPILLQINHNPNIYSTQEEFDDIVGKLKQQVEDIVANEKMNMFFKPRVAW